MSGVPLPWWAKIGAKLILSRLPARYAFWQRLGLFKHGAMEQPDYAYHVFRKHYDRVDFPRKGNGFVALELGPGDTLGSAVVAAALGASQTYLVDVGPFARRDVTPYVALQRYLEGIGLTPPDLRATRALDEVMTACRAVYLIDGLASLRSMPSESCDFVFSNAVYEHIRRAEVGSMTAELRRVLRPGGVTSHTVDLKDHLGGGLANLRFSDPVWESPFFANAGFYTNRLRLPDFVRAFRDAGLPPEIIRSGKWHRPPIRRAALAPMFAHYSDDELSISDFDLVARVPSA